MQVNGEGVTGRRKPEEVMVCFSAMLLLKLPETGKVPGIESGSHAGFAH